MSSRIDKLAGKFPRICAFLNSERILKEFEAAASVSPENLEDVKNSVDAEQSDFVDIEDILSHMKSKDSDRLYFLFLTVSRMLPVTSPFRIKVISDVDNTLVENPIIAPVGAPGRRFGDLIPGIVPFIRALSSDGLTTPTFVSARPNIAEVISIKRVKQNLQNSGLSSFTFKSGKLVGAISIVAKTSLVYKSLSSVKSKHIENLRRVYPAAIFVFFGDDAQGDEIFARNLVLRYPDAIAFIRRTSSSSFQPSPYHFSHSRVFYHSSYYEAIGAYVSSFHSSFLPNFESMVYSFIGQELNHSKIRLSSSDIPWLFPKRGCN